VEFKGTSRQATCSAQTNFLVPQSTTKKPNHTGTH